MAIKHTNIDDFDTSPWYTQFWPWFLITLPATVVVAGIATIILAVRSPVSLVNDDYYKQGLSINEDIAAHMHAATLGISAQINFDGQYMHVTLEDVGSQQLTLMLIHPTDSDQDQIYTLNQIGERRFEGLLSTPLSRLNDTRYSIRLVGHSESNKWILDSVLMPGTLHKDVHMSANPGHQVAKP